ncbi:MAG: alpha/beta fold hydrolase [Pirellulales bacterium]
MGRMDERRWYRPHWLRRHPWLAGALLAGLLFAGLNLLAWQHARALLVFENGGARTPPPASLSRWQKLQVLVRGPRIPKPANRRTPRDLGLAFETHTISLDGGVELEVWCCPRRDAAGVVVLFHGFSAAKSSVLGEARAFHDMGFQTVLADFRGSGGSNGRSTSIGYHEAGDVAAVVGFVRGRMPEGPLILYGQSMGSAAVLRSMQTAEVRPDAVVLESVFDRLLTTVGNRFEQMGVPSFPSAQLLVFWGGVQVGFSGFEHNPAEYAKGCRCPALMLHGAGDLNARPAEARAVYRNLCGPKHFEELAGAGHSGLYAADPERWRQAVEQFLIEQGLMPVGR